MVPLGVHHIAVVVQDLGRAEAFYAGVLGLPVLRRWDDAGGAPRAVWLALAGGAFLALERAGQAEPARADQAPGFHCVALGITPAERHGWKVKLAGAGHPVETESPYTLYVRDPDHNLVALSHHPHAHP